MGMMDTEEMALRVVNALNICRIQCNSSITDRSNEHELSECFLIADHPGSHYDPRTECHWTDETHYTGSEWDRACEGCGKKMDQSDMCKHECEEKKS